jgi:hypothetical protein
MFLWRTQINTETNQSHFTIHNIAASVFFLWFPSLNSDRTTWKGSNDPTHIVSCIWENELRGFQYFIWKVSFAPEGHTTSFFQNHSLYEQSCKENVDKVQLNPLLARYRETQEPHGKLPPNNLVSWPVLKNGEPDIQCLLMRWVRIHNTT